MPDRDDLSFNPAEKAKEVESSAYRRLRNTFITGLSVIVPVIITLYVLNIALDFIFDALSLTVIEAMEQFDVADDYGSLITRSLAVLVLLVAIVVTGAVARFSVGKRAIDYFDRAVGTIPGVGAVYKSFRQMGDVLVESDAENFREVVVVEYPHDESYLLGFKTTDTPEEVGKAVGNDDMVTLFLPLAPNPIMGGFLAHIPRERVHEVDMTVEEGIRTVATTGIAAGEYEKTDTKPLHDHVYSFYDN